MNESDDRGVSQFSIDLPINGYDVEVNIYVGAIERQIRRTEKRDREEINQNGRNAFDLSRFATVSCGPTDQKWSELARFEEGSQ